MHLRSRMKLRDLDSRAVLDGWDNILPIWVSVLGFGVTRIMSLISEPKKTVLKSWIEDRVRWLLRHAFEAGPAWYARNGEDVLETVFEVEEAACGINLDLNDPDECCAATPDSTNWPTKYWEYVIEPISPERLRGEGLDPDGEVPPDDATLTYRMVLDICEAAANGYKYGREYAAVRKGWLP